MIRVSQLLSFALACCLALVFADAAEAQIDVESVSFYRTVDRVAAGVDGDSGRFQVVVRVSGATSVVLDLPVGPDETLTEDPNGTWIATVDFTDPADLDDDFPSSPAETPYQLNINSGARLIDLDYEIPALPADWKITSPVHESDNNSTTNTLFEFDPCPPASCSNDDDHVLATIQQGAAIPNAGIVTDANAGSYSPVDENGDPFELPQNANLTFNAQLTAWRTIFDVSEPTDPFTFFNVYFFGDAVDFGTAFAGLDDAPTGPFSIATADPAAGILVPGGNVTTTIAGVDVDYDFEVDARGKLTGSGSADIDDNAAFETPFTVKGKLSGKNAMATQKLTFKLKNKDPGTEASANYKNTSSFDIAAGTVEVEEQTKGKILGVPVNETNSASGAFAATTDWQIDFTLDTENGKKLLVSAASATIAGTTIPLTGSGSFNAAKLTSNLTLRSGGDDKGVTAKIKNLEIDAMDNIIGGTVTLKAYGQNVTLDLAP